MGMNLLKRDFIIREPLLVSILVLITVLFSAVTHAYSQAYDRRRAALGIEWFERGRWELKNKRASSAVEDFRTALIYDPRNLDFRMYLADALTQAGHTDQALTYYLGLWQSSPSNGPVNLELARLFAQKGDSNSAERYFNGAIFGDWPENPEANRRTASLELVNFYLDHGDHGHAESQLIILSDNLPEDPQLHVLVAELYSRVGNDQRALSQYRQAMQLDPNNLQSLRGAGEAAFRLGDYHTAQAYASRSLHLDESDSSAKRLLAVIQSILSLNPYEHGLSETEKIKRTLQSFDIAGNRLRSCSSSAQAAAASSIDPSIERRKELNATANARFLRQHPEELDTLFDFSTSAEKIAQSACGEPSPEDSALLAIANRRGVEDR
jgi:tetratricopeptide (TPR) repeat protein